MLKRIHLTNFKSFSDQVVEFSPLTILLGENGAGKSSIIQALLLLHQSNEASGLAYLNLNGPLCSIGVGRDALWQGAEADRIELGVTDANGREFSFAFQYQSDADRLARICDAEVPPFLNAGGFGYLSAERIGPRLSNPRSIALAAAGQFGVQGQGALAVLEHFRAKILRADDPRRKGQAGSLEELFQTYLAAICTGARVELQPYGAVDSIGSTFVFSAPGGIPGESIRPTNVGFGVSYALPIILACLTAEPDSILIIENPEAHLHTRSQRAMCELIALTALSGCQVIVETHSREIFHWLRSNARSGQIAADIGRLNYIEAGYSIKGDRVSKCTSLHPLDANLDGWPANFFDAYGAPNDLIAPIPMP